MEMAESSDSIAVVRASKSSRVGEGGVMFASRSISERSAGVGAAARKRFMARDADGVGRAGKDGREAMQAGWMGGAENVCF